MNADGGEGGTARQIANNLLIHCSRTTRLGTKLGTLSTLLRQVDQPAPPERLRDGGETKSPREGREALPWGRAAAPPLGGVGGWKTSRTYT